MSDEALRGTLRGGLALPGIADQRFDPAPDDATPPARFAWSRESWAGVVILLIVSLLRSLSKFTYSDSPDDSIEGQLIWGGLYAFAAYRLFADPWRTVLMAKRSVPLFVFLGVTALSCLWALDTVFTLKNVVELIGTTLVGWYFVSRFTLEEFVNILVVAFGAIVVMSALLVFGSPTRGRMDWGAGVWCGVFAEKNGLGAAMALTILTVLSALAIGDIKRRILLSFVLVSAAGLLAGSDSITAGLSGAGAALVVSTIWAICRKRFSVVAAAVGIATVGWAVVFGILGLDANTFLESVGRNGNLTGRTEMWPYLLDAIGDRPILGYGYEAFFHNEILTSYLGPFIATYSWIPPHAHDSFIQIALDSGYLGLGIFLVVLGTALKRAVMLLVRTTRVLDFWPLLIVVYLVLGSYDETYFAQPNSLEWICFIAASLYPIRPAESDRPGVPGLGANGNLGA
jgi:O-antigen ligase